MVKHTGKNNKNHKKSDDKGFDDPLDPLGLLGNNSRKPGKKLFQYKPNPKRQLFFIALALMGIAIGYGLGFVFKKPASMNTPPVEKSSLQTEQPAKGPQTQTDTSIKPAPKKPSSFVDEEKLPANTVMTGPEKKPLPLAKPEPKPEAKPEAKPKAKPESKSSETPVYPKSPVIKQTVTSPPKTEQSLKEPAKSFEKPLAVNNTPVIAMVIDDMGIDKKRSKRIVALPGILTTSYIAYASKLKSQVAASKAAGNEILLHLPMEPTDASVDPGPNVLLTGIPEKELRQKIQWNLGQFKGYIGVNNHMGSRFTSDLPSMRILMEELKKKNLWFFDSITSGKSKGRVAAKEMDIPFTTRNIFIDHDENTKVIQQQLKKVERLAKKQGYAIAIGHPRENTIRALEPWIKTVEGRGFKLVHLSTLVKPWPKPKTASTTKDITKTPDP